MTTASHDTDGLRERKKRMTRAALREAAVRLFREHGPAAVTVEDICAEAGVSPRTFFNYFSAKEETVLPFTGDTHEQIVDELRNRPGDEPPLRAARNVLLAVLARVVHSQTWQDEAKLLREHPQLLHRAVAANNSTRLALAAGLGERMGRDPRDPYVRLVAATSATAIRVAIDSTHDVPAAPDGQDPTETLDAAALAFDRLERGLSPPER